MNMRWLLWKDYRQNRPIVIATLFFFLVPHLLALYGCFWMSRHPAELTGGAFPSLASWCQEMFCMSSMYSIIVCQLAVAAIGGNAFAGERVDRSAEFLASLPISRRKILSSKLIFALIVIGAIWLVDGITIYWLAERLALIQHGPSLQEFIRILGWTALTGAVFFSVAWWLSSILSSPTFAVCGGLAVPAFFIGSLAYIAYLLHIQDAGDFVADLYFCSCLVTAPLCFGLGTWYYMRRVEP